MKITVTHETIEYLADLATPLDISIPMGQVRCFYAPPVKMIPYTNGDFIGSVKKGAPVNFFNVELNPHGNGTHTECLGHITYKQESVNKAIKQYHFFAQLVSVDLTPKGNSDKVITLKSIKDKLPKDLPEAIVIRTKPNRNSKKKMDYSDTNPPYLDKMAMQYLVDKGVKHLLIDLPSVDREVDQGLLASHHIFWKVGDGYQKSEARTDCTITEMIFVDNNIKDGLYLLNLQTAPLELDATPSRPTLYKLTKKK